MRDLKFRVWDFFTARMINCHEPIIANRILPLCLGYESSEVQSYVLMQYTGLKDKNGVEIFEGDELVHGSGRAVVIWDHSFWAVDVLWSDRRRERMTLARFGIGGELTGKNIYQNPELMELRG